MAPRRLNRSPAARGIGATALAVASVLVAIGGCRPREPAPAERPTAVARSTPLASSADLVVLLVIDQARADYFERFDELFVGGLRRLLDEGTVFTRARHAHAVTQTAPGHATLATGAHPSRHGIIGNYWFERDGTEVYSAEDDDEEPTAERLLSPTLGDRMKSRWPGARVFGVSAKDRSAILLAGRDADGAFWFEEEDGVMDALVPDAVPPWLETLNAERPAEAWLGKAWEPLPVPPEVLERVGVHDLDFGPLEPDFPHVFGRLRMAADEPYFEDLEVSPFLDELLLDFATRLVEEEGLGSDAEPDLLAVSLSAADAVGHTYGASSREVLDVLLRLDRRLGEFLDALEARVAPARLLVALSSDHGAVPPPEAEASGTARRVTPEDVLCVQSVDRQLRERFGDRRWLAPGPFVDEASVAAAGVTREEVLSAVEELLAGCAAVAGVLRREALAALESDADEAKRAFARSVHADRSPDLLLQWQEGFLPYPGVASQHGSAYAYDRDVPLIVWPSGGAAGRRVEKPVETVDLAPTLAAWLGLPDREGFDGRDLSELIVIVPAD